LYSISKTINQYFVGIDIDKIEKLKIILKGNLVNYKDFISNVINRISKFDDKVSAVNFYYDGLTNILNFKEYFDVKRAKEFMSLVQDKDAILEIIRDEDNVGDFSVIIGSENSTNLLKENSIIRSTFRSNNQNDGILGIIGPLRLDYRECVRIVWMVSYNITKTINSIVR
ncbi:MAG: HrcA family transcriptional regulator, partial [Peptoniphilus sp.]|nr:HrcA family transcriptional regulator [Peptoniphilus sp.]